MDLAAARPEPIPVYAEMSSINPVFILNGALAERAEEMAPACMVRSRWAWDNSAPARDWFLSSPARGQEKIIARLRALMAPRRPRPC